MTSSSAINKIGQLIKLLSNLKDQNKAEEEEEEEKDFTDHPRIPRGEFFDDPHCDPNVINTKGLIKSYNLFKKRYIIIGAQGLVSKPKKKSNKKSNINILKVKDKKNGNIHVVKRYYYNTKNSVEELYVTYHHQLRWFIRLHDNKIITSKPYECYVDNKRNIIYNVMKCWDCDLLSYIHPYKLSNNNILCKNQEFASNIFLNIKYLSMFIKEITKKLNKLHEINCIFYDLKPSNLVMDVKSNDKIIFDFIDYDSTIAYVDEKTGLEEVESADGGYTRVYCAPELKLDKAISNINYKFDIYSFGVSIMEIIMAQHPYSSDHLEYVQNMKYNLNTPNNKSDYKLFINQMLTKFERYINDNNIYYGEHSNKLFLNLISNMIKQFPKDRYSTNDIMNHLWFKRYCK